MHPSMGFSQGLAAAVPPKGRVLASESRASRSWKCQANGTAKEVTLLDYGAGNVRSVRNAIKRLGYEIKDVSVWGVE